MKKIFNSISLIFTCLLLANCAHSPPQRDVSSNDGAALQGRKNIAWVEYGPQTSYFVRVITNDATCPQLLGDSTAIPMQSRNVLHKEDFTATICEAQVPRTISMLKLEDKFLPLPKREPRRILVIGDSGCQIKSKAGQVVTQNCNSESEWPFAKVAKSAALWKPDLVIHVGDYHYREIPCQGDSKCQGAISGDNLDSWIQDFFDPAAPLLEVSPWVFIRGNHELCERGGYGWFNLLDPRGLPSTCVDQTDPYSIAVGDHRFLIVDSATDVNINPSLDKFPSVGNGIQWLILHRPFLTPGADDETTTHSELTPSLLTPGRLSFVLTGHQHHLSLNTFVDVRPPELISGNGGTALEIVDGISKPIGIINGDGFQTKVYSDFGFMTLERFSKSFWKVIVHDREGKNILECGLNESTAKKSKLICPLKQ